MELRTVKLETVCRDRLNLLRDKLGLSSQTETLNILFDFVEKYNIDLNKEFSNSALDQLLFSMNETLNLVKNTYNNLGNLVLQEDKNTTRVIKILQAQERDILLPILRNDVKIEADKIIKKELEQNQDIQYLQALPKNENLIELQEENRLLKNKIAYLEKQNSNSNSTSEYDNTLRNVAKLFSKSLISGNYSASLSDSDYKKIFNKYV